MEFIEPDYKRIKDHTLEIYQRVEALQKYLKEKEIPVEITFNINPALWRMKNPGEASLEELRAWLNVMWDLTMAFSGEPDAE